MNKYKQKQKIKHLDEPVSKYQRQNACLYIDKTQGYLSKTTYMVT